MDSRTLTVRQAEGLQQAIAQHAQYFGRLRNRMEKVGFVPGDPLYERVKKAHDATHDLSVHVHYLVCDLVKKR